LTSTYSHALVTGGAGFIGSRLARRLLDDGLEVTVLDNLSVGTPEAVDSRARLVVGDVRNQATVVRALDGVDCVFHLAAQVTIRGSIERFYDDVDNTLMGTVNLLRCVDPTHIKQFTLASSMAVYADASSPAPIPETHACLPLSPYGVSKLASEQICGQILALREVPFTGLRYFNTFGPGQTFTPYVGVITIFITKLLRGERPVIFGDGEQQRDFVHVDDIVAGTAASLGGPAGVFNLGTGRPTSVNRLAKLLVDKIAPGLKPEHAPAHPGELRFSIADITRASAQLHYRPQRSLEADIEALITSIEANLS